LFSKRIYDDDNIAFRLIIKNLQHYDTYDWLRSTPGQITMAAV